MAYIPSLANSIAFVTFKACLLGQDNLAAVGLFAAREIQAATPPHYQRRLIGGPKAQERSSPRHTRARVSGDPPIVNLAAHCWADRHPEWRDSLIGLTRPSRDWESIVAQARARIKETLAGRADSIEVGAVMAGDWQSLNYAEVGACPSNAIHGEFVWSLRRGCPRQARA